MPRFSLTALLDRLARPRVTLPESVWANHRTFHVDTTWVLEPHSIPPGVVGRVTDRFTADPAMEQAHAEMPEED